MNNQENSSLHSVFIYPQIKKLTGAQRLILALAKAVADYPVGENTPPHRVTLLTHQIAPECWDALPENIQIIETGANLNRTHNHYLDSLIEYGSVPALVRHIPQDADNICFFGPPSLPGLLWAKLRLRPRRHLLYFCYEPPRAAYTDRQQLTRRMGKIGFLVSFLLWLYRPLDRFLARQADTLLVNAHYTQQVIKATYDRDATIITHGVELPQPANLERSIDYIRTRYNLADRQIILTVNHLHPRKRLDLLLLAMPDILRQHPNATALFIGIGPEETALKKLAQELNLDEKQVVFAGFVPEDELAAYYATAAVYPHMGRVESFGLSVLEASAAGLPVVAANEGGVGEIVQDGKSGFLVAANSANFADKISWLLANPAKAAAMGEFGRTYTRDHYTWQQGARAFLQAVTN